MNETSHEAYKIVDGKEVENIDPCIGFAFNGDTFSIWNGRYEYEQPLADLTLWRVREIRYVDGGKEPVNR